MGDQLGHPQGVQVKAPNYRFSFPPLQWTGEGSGLLVSQGDHRVLADSGLDPWENLLFIFTLALIAAGPGVECERAQSGVGRPVGESGGPFLQAVSITKVA